MGFLLQVPAAPFVQDAVAPGQLPQLTVAPSLFDQALDDFAELHAWQVFPALVTPLPTKAPPIQHPVWQLSPLQTWPVPQLVPFPSGVHDVEEEEAWQVRHELAESTAPLA